MLPLVEHIRAEYTPAQHTVGAIIAANVAVHLAWRPAAAVVGRCDRSNTPPPLSCVMQHSMHIIT